MCLNLVYAKKSRRRFGYKVMYLRPDGKLQPFFYSRRGYHLNRWYTDKPSTKEIRTPDGRYYPSGFHFWHEKEDAEEFFWYHRRIENMVLAKVEVSEILASGTQYRFEGLVSVRTSVARMMKIIKILRRERNEEQVRYLSGMSKDSG